jgi:hypothetical protein
MRGLRLICLILVLIVGFISFASIVSAEEKKATPKAKPVKGLYLYGSVVSINKDAKLMTVKGWRGNVTLDVSNASLKGFKDIREISPGDKIRARYTNFGIEINKVGKGKK